MEIVGGSGLEGGFYFWVGDRGSGYGGLQAWIWQMDGYGWEASPSKISVVKFFLYKLLLFSGHGMVG